MAEEDENEQLERYIRKIARDEAARSGGGGGGGGGDVDIGQFGKFIHAAKDMKDALTSDVDKALSGAVSTKIVEQVIPSMSPQPRASAGFWDTGGGIALMNKIGDQAATVLDMVFNRIGNERVGKLADGIADTFLGGGKTSEENISLSLDPDNPADMHKYMALRNITDPNIARKALIEEKQLVMQRVKTGGAGQIGAGGGGNGGVGTDFAAALETQNAMLREMLKARQEDRSALVQMWQSMEELKKEQAKIKAGIVNRGEKDGGFNIDTIRDRGNGIGKSKAVESVEDKLVVDKSVEDKSVEDKSVEDKLVEDKLVVDKSVEDKLVEDKSVEDKSVEDKSVEDKLVVDVDIKEEKTEKVVVNKKKGTPKWKDDE